MKYAQEARLCLGVVALPKDNIGTNGTINNDSGELIGIRLPPFIYSGKVILSISDWKKKEESEIKRVKGLQRNPTWVVSKRINKVLYMNDEVHRVKSVGKMTANKLKEVGICTVQELVAVSDDELAQIAAKSGGGLSINNISKYRKIAIESVTAIPDCFIHAPTANKLNPTTP